MAKGAVLGAERSCRLGTGLVMVLIVEKRFEKCKWSSALLTLCGSTSSALDAEPETGKWDGKTGVEDPKEESTINTKTPTNLGQTGAPRRTSDLHHCDYMGVPSANKCLRKVMSPILNTVGE